MCFMFEVLLTIESYQFLYSLIDISLLLFQYPEELKKLDPAFLGGLVQEVIPNDSCLVFCPTKKQCCHFSMLICQTLNP